MKYKNEETIDNEINLFNNLGLQHHNQKYIRSKEFTNILFEIIKNNLNNTNGGNTYEY